MATLKAKVSSLTERFDAIEARIDGVAAKQSEMETTLNSLVEAQHAVIASVSTLSDKLDSIATVPGKLNIPVVESPPRGARHSNAAAPVASTTIGHWGLNKKTSTTK